MRFAMLLAASAAFWVQPANAATVSAGLFAAPPEPGGYSLEFTFSAPVTNFVYWVAIDDKYNFYNYDGSYNGGNTVTADFYKTIAGPVSNIQFIFKLLRPYEHPWGAGVTKKGSYVFYGDVFRFEAPEGTTYTASHRFLTAVPEPATWALMLLGFGAVGAALRRKRHQRAVVSYS